MTVAAIDPRIAARLLGGDVSGRNNVRCPGPGHSRHDRSLSVTFRGDGFTVHSFAGDDWRDCKDHVKAVLGLSDERRPLVAANNDQTPLALVGAPDDEPARIRDAARLWASSESLVGTLAETYLASRGLSYHGDAIRFRPNCRSMIALMTDAVTGEPCGVHRTFLDGEGRKLDRKMKGRAKGAVVRLSADEDVTHGLGIAEGIETALATGFLPTWACLSAGTIKTFPVLAGVEALTIFADHDHAGITAANECGRRWHAAGCEVTITAPSVVGADFADMREAA
jgi:putative DNA primase/helicase